MSNTKLHSNITKEQECSELHRAIWNVANDLVHGGSVFSGVDNMV